MSKYRDDDQLNRDLVIAFQHPDYRDMDLLEALRALKRRRGEYV
jgi:hypothetical protein